MGSAPSIKDMQAKEDDFDTWVAKRTKAVVDECGKARDDLLKKFKEDFPQSDDMLTARDKYWADFTHIEKFTLANISKIIHQVTGALFGAPAGDEGGVEVTKPTIATLVGFSGAQALIAAKALNLVAGILNVFDTDASLKGTFQSGLEEVAPGLYVGVSARRTSYSGEGFFNNSTVVESYFVVLVKYSHKAFKASMGMLDDAAMADAAEKLRANFGSAFSDMLATTSFKDSATRKALSDALKDYKATLYDLENDPPPKLTDHN